MTTGRRWSQVTGAALVVAGLATAILRGWGGALTWAGWPAWRFALGPALALLALRIVALASAAHRRALPWPRLLLPTILLVEGAGLWSADGGPAWYHARLVTALGAEVAFIALAIRALRRPAGDHELPEERIALALTQLVPSPVARIIAYELVLLRGAVLLLLGRARPAAGGFSYHREATLRMLLWMLPLLLVGDVALLELVILPGAAPWLRIGAHVLGVYGLLWLIGLYGSMRTRPHQLVGDRLLLHRGLLGRVEFTLAEIVAVAPPPSFADDWKLRTYQRSAIRADVAGPTVLALQLRAPVQSTGMFGPGEARSLVLVSVDDPVAFCAALGRPGLP